MKNFYSIIFILMAGMYAKAQTVSGKVIDSSTKKPISFVEVTISPTNKSMHTDGNGDFKFTEVPNGTYTLHFLSSEYTYKKIEIKADKAKTIVDVVLQPSEVSLDEVVIFATPTQPTKRIGDALSTGTEITQKGIEAIGTSANNSIHSTLGLVPSVSVQSTDPYGVGRKDMRVRGVRSFLSGMTTEGIPNYGVSPIGPREDMYDKENLKSVSLYKGAVPADIFSATGNRGGSVEVGFKRSTKEPTIEFSQSFGGDNFKRSFVRFNSGEFSNTSAFGSFSYTEADKWKGSGKLVDRKNIAAGVSHKFNDKLNLEIFTNHNNVFRTNFRPYNYKEIQNFKNIYNRDFNSELTGIPSKDYFYQGYNQGKYENHNSILSFGYSPDEDNALSVKFYYNRENAEYDSTSKRGPNYIRGSSKRKLYQTGFTLNWKGTLGKIIYNLGYWFDTSNNEIPRKYRKITKSGLVDLPSGDVVSLKEGKGQIHNPYFKLSYQVNGWKFQAGLKYLYYTEPASSVYQIVNGVRNKTKEDDLSTNVKVNKEPLPSVGVGYQISEKIEAYANYGRGYMRSYMYMPTFNNYRNNRKKFKDQGLTYRIIHDRWKNETSDNFDLGLMYYTSKTRLSGNLYYSKQNDVKISIYDPQVEMNYHRNVGKMTTYGAELETYFQVFKGLTFFVNPSYNSMSFDDNLTLKSKGGIKEIKVGGKQSPAVPKIMTKTGLLYSKNGILANILMSYTGERYGDATNLEKISSSSVVDASIGYNFKKGKYFKSISFGLEIKNVLDKKYIGVISASDTSLEGRAGYYVGVPRTFIGSVKIDL